MCDTKLWRETDVLFVKIQNALKIPKQIPNRLRKLIFICMLVPNIYSISFYLKIYPTNNLHVEPSWKFTCDILPNNLN